MCCPELETLGTQVGAFLPLANKLCPSWEGEHRHMSQELPLECLKSPCTPSASQVTQESSNGQLPAAAPLRTCCELIPQHLYATTPGTLQLQRRYQEATQVQQMPLRTSELPGDVGLSMDSVETGCLVAFASRLASSSWTVLLCSLAHNGFNGGRMGRYLDFSLLAVVAAAGSFYRKVQG